MRYSWLQSIPPHHLLRLFSTPFVRDMARLAGGQKSHVLLRSLASHRDLRGVTLREVYSAAFKRLESSPAEYIYKNALVQRNVLSKNGSKRSKVFFEFRAGQSKLDALVARESIHAFEIKTELDHFRRLSTQIADYTRRFAHVWVFASERHASRAEREVPLNVGIALMSKKRTFDVVRDASRSVMCLQSDKILECLRRAEYLEVLGEFGFEAKNVPNTKVFSAAMEYARRLDPELIHEATLAQLKGRIHGPSAKSLSALPLSLRAAVVAARCDDSDVAIVLANLESKVAYRE